MGLEQSVYGNEREAGEASKKQASRRRSSVGAGIRNSYIKLLLFVAVSRRMKDLDGKRFDFIFGFFHMIIPHAG